MKTQTIPVKKTFLNPEQLLRLIPVEPGLIVADFGCGNGYYAVAAGVITGKTGQIFAIDILEDALSQTATLAKLVGTPNVSTKQCNLENFGACPIAETSCDLVIMASLLHQVKNKDNLLREAYRVLKTGGKILVVEWQATGPFGPPVSDRVSEDGTQKLLEKFSFRPLKKLPAGSFHYALLYQK